MPVSRLKNLVILILLLANGALLVLVVPNQLARTREQEQLHAALGELCARENVTLAAGAVPDTVTLYPLELREAAQADLRAATALLGEEVLVQDDSTRYLSTYRSALGRCSISRSGSFQAELTDGEITEDPERCGELLLPAMGFQIYRHGMAMEQSNGTRTVSAMQDILGVPVFSRGLTLTYDGNRLVRLEGTFFTGSETPVRVDNQACMSAADALTAFLAARFDLGWVGSAVTAMEQGYHQADTASAAAVHLTPVWRIDTDTGSFRVDGITGAVTIHSD